MRHSAFALSGPGGEVATADDYQQRILRLVNDCPEPIHPGGILKRLFLEPIGMTGVHLAHLTHVTPNTVSAVVSGRAGVSERFGRELARVLGTHPTFWHRLYRAYRQRGRITPPPPRTPRTAKLDERPHGNGTPRIWKAPA